MISQSRRCPGVRRPLWRSHTVARWGVIYRPDVVEVRRRPCTLLYRTRAVIRHIQPRMPTTASERCSSIQAARVEKVRQTFPTGLRCSLFLFKRASTSSAGTRAGSAPVPPSSASRTPTTRRGWPSAPMASRISARRCSRPAAAQGHRQTIVGKAHQAAPAALPPATRTGVPSTSESEGLRMIWSAVPTPDTTSTRSP
jgi:hypothetical protein